MKAAEALSRLRSLGVPVVSTGDAAVALDLAIDAASHTLRRLAHEGLVSALRRGLWSIDGPPDRLALAEYLTAPQPAYVSLQSAMYLRGMIEQIPEVVYLVSLGRSQTITTSVAVYRVHHVPPELFGGFEYLPDRGVKLAVPEKAIIDLLYLSGTRLRTFRSLPELELPRGFRMGTARRWIAKIPSPRLRTLVERRFEESVRPARGGGRAPEA